MSRRVQPVRRAAAPKYPALRVAWRILAATMPLVPAVAQADASVPGEHQPKQPDPPPPPMPGAPPAPRPVEPPKKGDVEKPPRLGGKVAMPTHDMTQQRGR